MNTNPQPLLPLDVEAVQKLTPYLNFQKIIEAPFKHEDHKTLLKSSEWAMMKNLLLLLPNEFEVSQNNQKIDILYHIKQRQKYFEQALAFAFLHSTQVMERMITEVAPAWGISMDEVPLSRIIKIVTNKHYYVTQDRKNKHQRAIPLPKQRIRSLARLLFSAKSEAGKAAAFSHHRQHCSGSSVTHLIETEALLGVKDICPLHKLLQHFATGQDILTQVFSYPDGSFSFRCNWGLVKVAFDKGVFENDDHLWSAVLPHAIATCSDVNNRMEDRLRLNEIVGMIDLTLLNWMKEGQAYDFDQHREKLVKTWINAAHLALDKKPYVNGGRNGVDDLPEAAMRPIIKAYLNGFWNDACDSHLQATLGLGAAEKLLQERAKPIRDEITSTPSRRNHRLT